MKLLNIYPEKQVVSWTPELRTLEGFSEEGMMCWRYGIPSLFKSRWMILPSIITFKDVLHSIRSKKCLKVVCYTPDLIWATNGEGWTAARYVELEIQFESYSAWSSGLNPGLNRNFTGWVANQRIEGSIGFDTSKDNLPCKDGIFDFEEQWRVLSGIIRPVLTAEDYTKITGETLDARYWKCV
jgi:hypothetical protein